MLWPQVFVILCVVLDITNGYYYTNNHRHRHRHVYNCGRNQRCGRRRGPPACKQWCVVYFMVGSCQQARYECCRYNEKPGYCPQDPAICSRPYPYYSTKTYECRHDFNCPSGYKCCRDSCYAHKVCKPLVPCISITSRPNQTTTSSTRDTEEMTTKHLVTKLPRTTTELVPTTSEETTTPATTTTTETTVDATTTPTTTPTPTTTTEELLTTPERPIETTTVVAIIPTEETTTTSSGVETTIALLTTTIAPAQPTEPSTTEKPSLFTTTDLYQTTLAEELGGSGDFEVPEPEAQRFMQGDSFGGLSDDEDFVKNAMDYQIVRV